MKYKNKEKILEENIIRLSTPEEVKEKLRVLIKKTKTDEELKYLLILFLASYERLSGNNNKGVKYLWKYLDCLRKEKK